MNALARPLADLFHRTCTTRSAAALALSALIAAGAAAREDSGTSLAVGETHAATLGTGEVHSYLVAADASSFIVGAADQVTVDVVVTIFDADGKELATFDGPGRGPERFRFETSSAGTCRIDVAPFEDETGDYTITLKTLEPKATSPEARVDQLMSAYDDPATPGGVVAVMQDGTVTFARAYGAANLTDDIPFEVDTRTNIGSTSKQFTAYAILLLAEQGKLSLDDDVRIHITELPDLGETVTLRHLLTHTSGYREFLNTLVLTGRRLDRGDHIDRSELIEVVQRQPSLQNSPGAEWNYNNTAFGLLAMVVERVGGAPFPEWMASNVFEPLGMNDTFVRSSPAAIIKHSSQGYVPGDAGGYRNATDLGGAMGAGGIYTTIDDLARWIRNFKTGDLGGATIFQQMSTPYELTSGDSTGYGFGLFIDEHRGLRRIHHGGADTAHRSMIMYFPELDAAVITQSNNSAFDGGIANSVAAAFFADAMEAEETDDTEETDDVAFDPAAFDPESFDRFAGRYELEEMPGFVLTFSREGDKYFIQATGQPRVDLVPTSPTSFALNVVEARVTFTEGADGEVDSLILHQGGEHAGKRLKEEAWAPTAEQLASYTGRYFSDELQMFYEVVVADDALVLKVRRLDDIALSPAKEHHFSASSTINEIAFEADDAGAITAFEVGNGRARGIRFERID